jgi:hypothetical protein
MGLSTRKYWYAIVWVRVGEWRLEQGGSDDRLVRVVFKRELGQMQVILIDWMYERLQRSSVEMNSAYGCGWLVLSEVEGKQSSEKKG